MYVDFFGLRELPFNNTPDPRFFFSTPDHEEALASLIYAVESRKGFVLLTGEVGAGKTLVSRMMLRHFGSQIAFANINHAVQSAPDLMEALCTEFDLPLPSVSTHARLVRTLHDFLLAQFAQNTPVVLILDEAQNLPDEAFEQLRMIGNLEADDAKLLQICIVGQPELQTRFAAPALRQLRQRLYRTFHLPALDRDATEAYIRRRLSVSGAALDDVFTNEAVDEIARLSRGLPRLINTICDNAMLSAYAANQRTINGPFVHTVSTQMMLVEPNNEQECDAAVVRPSNTPARATPVNATTGSRADNRSADPHPIAAPKGMVRAGDKRSAKQGVTAVGPKNQCVSAISGTASRGVVDVVRRELARMREELTRVMGATTRRVEALERRLPAKPRTFAAPPRPERDLSPVLIRAAAIVERAATGTRGSQSCTGSRNHESAVSVVSEPTPAPDRTTHETAAPSAEEVAAVVKHLDADARMAETLLRAWRTGEARRTSQLSTKTP